jgi:hypothetical protein
MNTPENSGLLPCCRSAAATSCAASCTSHAKPLSLRTAATSTSLCHNRRPDLRRPCAMLLNSALLMPHGTRPRRHAPEHVNRVGQPWQPPWDSERRAQPSPRTACVTATCSDRGPLPLAAPASTANSARPLASTRRCFSAPCHACRTVRERKEKVGTTCVGERSKQMSIRGGVYGQHGNNVALNMTHVLTNCLFIGD